MPLSFSGDLDSLRNLLLLLSEERSLEGLLRTIVRQITNLPSAVMARIWLRGPGDSCATCTMQEACRDHSACLHLAASGGIPGQGADMDWSRLDGTFRRIPLSADLSVILEAGSAPGGSAESRNSSPTWGPENIRGFLGLPLVFKGEYLGTLAVFFRTADPPEREVPWLRVMSEHAAVAISNAQAFEEIARLKVRCELENQYLREEVTETQGFGDMVGVSPALRNVARQIELVAPTNATVLILGESGTGKEMVAREIHRRSSRGDRPMIRVNCASIPRDLYESEFFGHATGAFTGAQKERAGRFQAADGGTLFLDEVGEIPLELQSKLLRVLQEGQYERVGEEITRRVDVRIIAATNLHLKREIERGQFRQDLYFRLNVFPIEIPPLRQRLEDIPHLAARFLEIAARKYNCRKFGLMQADIIRLQSYDWPGNVRELQNIVERAAITAHTGPLHFDLPGNPLTPALTKLTPAGLATGEDDIIPDQEMKLRVRENIRRALNRTGGRIYGKNGAAELLGMKPTTLVSRIRKLRIKQEN
jgi:transcriptional regulator with GAF, ATPase, and Fis domain